MRIFLCVKPQHLSGQDLFELFDPALLKEVATMFRPVASFACDFILGDFILRNMRARSACGRKMPKLSAL